jgi:hypothetical protein
MLFFFWQGFFFSIHTLEKLKGGSDEEVIESKSSGVFAGYVGYLGGCASPTNALCGQPG